MIDNLPQEIMAGGLLATCFFAVIMLINFMRSQKRLQKKIDEHGQTVNGVITDKQTHTSGREDDNGNEQKTKTIRNLTVIYTVEQDVITKEFRATSAQFGKYSLDSQIEIIHIKSVANDPRFAWIKTTEKDESPIECVHMLMHPIDYFTFNRVSYTQIILAVVISIFILLAQLVFIGFGFIRFVGFLVGIIVACFYSKKIENKIWNNPVGNIQPADGQQPIMQQNQQMSHGSTVHPEGQITAKMGGDVPPGYFDDAPPGYVDDADNNIRV